MKKAAAVGLLAICLSTILVGCGDKNNSATDATDAPGSTAEATDNPMDTNTPEATDSASNDQMDNDGNDLSDDVKDGVDNAADGVKDAVDGVDDAVDDATKSQ